MTATSPSAFALSATLHAAVVAIALLLNYASSREKESPRILELVAGEGNDFMAKEAPALGTESGTVLAIAKQPIPQPPATPPPQPKATPQPPVPKAPPAETTPDFKKQIKDDMRATDRKVKREIAKQHAEEEKRQKVEQKRQEEEAKRMSKEEFDKKHANDRKVASAVPSKTANIKKIDVKGVTGGVEGGSSASKAGARGKALTAEEGAAMDRYFSLFKQELRREFLREPPPGLADTLQVDIELISNPDGSFARVRISKSSGVKEFDNAVLDAIRRVKMPARPDRKVETVGFTFHMRERGEG